MAKPGNLEEPQPSEEGAENPENNATELDESVDAMFDATDEGESPKPAAEPDGTDEGDEDGEIVDAAEEEEDSDDDEHENVFSEQGYKIFKGRIGKEKAKREKVVQELEAANETIAQLKKDADPNVRSAMESGIDSRFIETADAATLAEAAKIDRKISWLEQISEDPDGYEDEKGNSFTQVQVLASLGKASRSRENQKILAKAETIREAALARQAEVIEAGVKALADQAKAKAALKKKPAKVKATAAPGAKRNASIDLEPPAAPGNLSRVLKKEGYTEEALARNF